MTPLLVFALTVAADPVRTAWIMSPAGSAALGSAPEVHSVTADESCMMVRSAGLSLRYLGPLQQAPTPSESLGEFVFRIPLHPAPETGTHSGVPVDVIGTFVNGLPIYNQFEALSWNGANLWHYDAVAYNDDGALTAAGHPRAELTHPVAPGLLDRLAQNGSRHSPVIGFALDGYPVYGPWAYANADGSGGLRRMRSSYRLRSITRREGWADETMLTPEQYGPAESAAEPPGTFAEDYEYIPGSGDLDEFNGRFTQTPEYPGGTYAYFLATDAAGRLAFPYLIGPRFYGKVEAPPAKQWHTIARKRLTLSSDVVRIEAGRQVHFRLDARTASGDSVRHFEYVHERPIHFVIASADLAEFDHIHPELAGDDTYQVAYTFARGGRYRVWADYSLPGEAPHVDAFDIDVSGVNRPTQKLASSAEWTQSAGSLTVALAPSKPVRAGSDVPITLRLTGSTETLEPYLGAWAHVIVAGDNLKSYAHVHPMESASPAATMAHTHTISGPPPSEIHIAASFPAPGWYKLWAQFQQAGQVLTLPFLLRVGAPDGSASAVAKTLPAIPANATRIRVTAQGYTPVRFDIPANSPVTLAFTREATASCGSEVVFPALGIRRALPLGGTVLVDLPAQPAGEISFTCGMGMYKGMMVAR